MSSQIPPSLLWIAAFASICVPVLALTWLLLKRLYPSLPREDKAAVCWFMVYGVFGMVFIGDMFRCLLLSRVESAPIQDSSTTSQWTRFGYIAGNSDSDPFMFCFQIISAAILAPLSFILTFLITSKHLLRHPLQIIVCSGQLHSKIVYSGIIIGRHVAMLGFPKDIQSTAFLHVVVVSLLAIIPSILLHSSITATLRIFTAFRNMSAILSQRHNSTPMKPRINPQRISTASITFSKLDLGKPGFLVRVDEKTAGLDRPGSLNLKQDVKEKEAVNVSRKEEGQEKVKENGAKAKQNEHKIKIPAHSNPNFNSNPANPPTEPATDPNLDLLDYYSNSQPFTPLPELEADNASIPTESDDESLGEIVVDKRMIIEGIRNRKSRS